MTTKNSILAHDLGTTGNKATLYDAEGVLVDSAFYAYDTDFPHTAWAEQNPEDWWQAVCVSTRQLLRQCDLRGDEIACITFSGQMMGCVALDKNARPLRPSIIWADQRATDQIRWLEARLTPAESYAITGHRLSESYSLSKLLWVRDHQPEIYRSVHKFVQAKDAMVARLTGIFATDPSDASGTNLYDLEHGGWSKRIIEAAEINPEQLPTVYPSVAVVGEVLPEVADEVGVAAGTPVVMGGGDGSCAAVGAGVVREGAAYNYLGSSSWISLATPQPIYDPQQNTYNHGHVVPDMFTPIGTMQAAGASYQWSRDQLAGREIRAAAALKISPYELMNLESEQSPVGANGLLFLPHLIGERSPRWNPQARGAFIGLTIRHTRADMLRAVLEGVSFNLRLILDVLRAQGTRIDAMRVIGGGARSRFWNQMLADMYGVPVQRLATLEEATSMGAALAGGIGVGMYPNFDMIERMNRVVEVIEPNPQAAARYAEMLPVFDAAYHALAPISDRLAALAKLPSGNG